MTEMNWDIRRMGRAWQRGEARARYELAPEKSELIDCSVPRKIA
jgi:hypothetical protein